MLVSQHNPAMSDIAQSLTNSLSREGRGSMLADLPMGGHKIANLARGTNANDAATVAQLTDAVANPPRRADFVPIAGQTRFPVSGDFVDFEYDPATLAVFVDGLLIERSEYAAPGGTTAITFALPMQGGEFVSFNSYISTGADDDGPDVTVPPAVAFAATAADWSALPNLARKIRQAAFKGTDTAPIRIKIAGVGSSNMLNEGGGLAGAGNSPVEVALRQAKALLDPFGWCVWDFANFGVNGSAIVSFNDPAAGGGNSPQQNLVAYDPDLTIVCYGTNDSAPESWNTGQTRDYVPIGIAQIASFCASIDSDSLFLTVPSAHVGKTAPIGINQGIPVLYPKTSFQVGQSPFQVSFTYTASNQRITGPAGVFTNAGNGFGLAAGKAVFSTDENLGSSIPNVGIYRIAEIDPAGAWIRVDRKLTINSVGVLVDAGSANIVDSGPVNAAIKRVGIDNVTELQPDGSHGDVLIDPLGDGRTVRVLARYFDVNQLTRETVPTLDVPASLVDMEAGYILKLLTNSEDRYYATSELVHWNSVFVADVMEPAFEAYFRSLGAVPRALANSGFPPYQRRLVVRPGLGLLAENAQVARQSSVDIQVAAGEDAILRNSRGKRSNYTTDESEPKRYDIHFNPGYEVQFKPYRQNRSFTTSNAFEDLTIPNDCRFTIHIDVYRSGIGRTNWRVEGMNVAGTVTFTAVKEHETGNPNTVTLSAVGAAVRMTLFSPTSQTTINAYQWIRPESPVST